MHFFINSVEVLNSAQDAFCEKCEENENDENVENEKNDELFSKYMDVLKDLTEFYYLLNGPNGSRDKDIKEFWKELHITYNPETGIWSNI